MNKTLMFNIRISEEEKAELKEFADKAGLSLSQFIRQSVLLNSIIRETIDEVDHTETDEEAIAVLLSTYDKLFEVVVESVAKVECNIKVNDVNDFKKQQRALVKELKK